MAKFEDLTAQKFGRLTALEFAFNSKLKRSMWKCLCICGNYTEVNASDLKRKKTQSCGCLFKDTMKERFKDLTGRKFGRLTIIERDRSCINRTKWLCHCDCGNKRSIRSEVLLSGSTQSCSCLQKEISSKLHRKAPGVATWNYRYYEYEKNAKQRNLKFELNLYQFKEICLNNCYYCGAAPSSLNYVRSRKDLHLDAIENSTIATNGIDRLNNVLGYALDNCVACCTYCNWIKKDKTQKELYEHIAKMFSTIKNRGLL